MRNLLMCPREISICFMSLAFLLSVFLKIMEAD